MTIMWLAMAVPSPVRRPVFRPLAALAERMAARRPSSLLPGLAFIARRAAGPPERAAELARSLGTRPRTPPLGRRKLTLLAAAAGLDEAAAAIVVTIPGDPSPGLEAVRARVAFDQGRYTDSLADARRAVAGGVRAAKQLVEQA